MRRCEPGLTGAASPQAPVLFIGVAIVASQLVTP